MNSPISRYAMIIALASFCQVGHAESSEPMDDRLRRMSDVVCGPRCVKFVLKKAGIESDLIRLIEDTQWPHREEGASLDALHKTLTKHGLHAMPIQIVSSAQINWPHPVIMHMKPTKADEIGHYIVLLPENNDDSVVHIWDGLAGIRSISIDQLYRDFSGNALLTAPKPITDPLSAIRTPNYYRVALWLIIGGVIAGILCVRVRWFQ